MVCSLLHTGPSRHLTSKDTVSRERKGHLLKKKKGSFLRDASGKGSTCQCMRCKRREFDPWVRKIPWKKKWQPTPVFLSGEFHGQRSLVGYSLWGRKESNTTAHTHTRENIEPLPPAFLLLVSPIRRNGTFKILGISSGRILMNCLKKFKWCFGTQGT